MILMTLMTRMQEPQRDLRESDRVGSAWLMLNESPALGTQIDVPLRHEDDRSMNKQLRKSNSSLTMWLCGNGYVSALQRDVTYDSLSRALF
jgi:hypothetical protein